MNKNQNLIVTTNVAAPAQDGAVTKTLAYAPAPTIDTNLSAYAIRLIKNIPVSNIAGVSAGAGKTKGSASNLLYNFLPSQSGKSYFNAGLQSTLAPQTQGGQGSAAPTRKLLNNINTILNYFFASFYILISKPVLLFTPGKLVISLNYYKPEPNSKLSNRYIWKYGKVPSRSGTGLHSEFTGLIDILSKLTNKKVELQLNQLNYPFHDSTILSKLISLNSNQKKFVRIIRILMSKATIITKNFSADESGLPFYTVKNEKGQNVSIHTSTPTVLSGIRIQISGRLATQRVVPKRTINKKQKGGFACTNRNIVDFAQYTNKNKRGAYTVKVWTSHKIIN